MSDPLPIAYALFAFALALFGVRFVGVGATTLAAGATTEALNYALLAAAVAETVAGVLAIVRGGGYPAYVISIFGIWLIGFFALATIGSGSEQFTPDAFAWYLLILLVPLAIMAVPAIVHRNVPFSLAFVALIVMFLFAGLGFHDLNDALNSAAASKSLPNVSTAVDLVKVSAWASFVAAAAIWWVFAYEVFTVTGVLRGSGSRPAPSGAGQTEPAEAR
jgi:hypothetical protein